MEEYFIVPSFAVTRCEMIEDLQKQVKRIKNIINISELLSQGRTRELGEFQQEINLSTCETFIEGHYEMLIYKEEIPEGCLLEAIFFLRFLAEKTGVLNCMVFDNFYEIVDDLIASNSNIERRIGVKLEEKELCEMKLNDFIVPEKTREYNKATTRYETVKNIQEQVKKLNAKKVGEMISEGIIEKLEALQDEIDVTTINSFFEYHDHLQLSREEMPEGCFLETIFFLRFFVAKAKQKGLHLIYDVEIFYDAGLFVNNLICSENEVEQRIGKRMYEKELYDMELEEIFGL